MDVSDIWGSSDYAPTAAKLEPATHVIASWLAQHHPHAQHVLDLGAGHGHLARLLVQQGYSVTALEPVDRMIQVGRVTCPQATWVQGLGEDTGLADNSVDVIASNFGAFLCGPSGPEEWARLLRPGGHLVMTTWSTTGFLAEMTQRMQTVLNPEMTDDPPHMVWGEPGVAEARLTPWLTDVTVTEHSLDWHFDSIEAGMRLYREGSPTHTWSLKMAGRRADELEQVLNEHLLENADRHGRVKATTNYCLVTALVA